MPTIHITITHGSLSDLDAICKRSGYSRSEQVAGMIEAAKVEEQEILRLKQALERCTCVRCDCAPCMCDQQ